MCPTTINSRPRPSRVILLGAALLLGTVGSAHPMSTLSLDGALDFSAATDQIQIDGVLTATAGLAPAPVLAGSQVHVAASFIDATSHGGITTATFGTAPGAPDVVVIGGDNTLLLAGELVSLSAVGVNGLDSAVLSGELAPTGGALMAMFTNPAGLMELQLDLSAPFRSGIFNRDFTGHVNGRLESSESITGPVPQVPASVPEPATWVLLTVGLLGLPARHLRRSRRHAMALQRTAS
jgi:hypothetical protein